MPLESFRTAVAAVPYSSAGLERWRLAPSKTDISEKASAVSSQISRSPQHCVGRFCSRIMMPCNASRGHDSNEKQNEQSPTKRAHEPGNPAQPAVVETRFGGRLRRRSCETARNHQAHSKHGNLVSRQRSAAKLWTFIKTQVTETRGMICTKHLTIQQPA